MVLLSLQLPAVPSRAADQRPRLPDPEVHPCMTDFVCPQSTAICISSINLRICIMYNYVCIYNFIYNMYTCSNILISFSVVHILLVC